MRILGVIDKNIFRDLGEPREKCPFTLPLESTDCLKCQNESFLDNLIDFLELTVYGTDWQDADTDDDGQSDAQELDCGADPLDAESRCNQATPWLWLLLDN